MVSWEASVLKNGVLGVTVSPRRRFTSSTISSVIMACSAINVSLHTHHPPFRRSAFGGIVVDLRPDNSDWRSHQNWSALQPLPALPPSIPPVSHPHLGPIIASTEALSRPALPQQWPSPALSALSAWTYVPCNDWMRLLTSSPTCRVVACPPISGVRILRSARICVTARLTSPAALRSLRKSSIM